jgi:phosphoribosylformylglycinamidine synthase
MAVAEVCRNLACSGAEPVGITDCLNFGNPERPEVMEQFSRAVDGIAAACHALGVPVVSGNVSLYNETDRRSVLPTPAIAAVGLVGRREHIVTSPFKRAGDAVLLLGESACRGARALSGGEWLTRALGIIRGEPPPIDLATEARLQKLLIELARSALLESAHDVSDGGLAVALAECCAMGPENVGARIELPASATPLDAIALLFGESPSRAVVSVRASAMSRVLERARSADIVAARIGETGADRLVVAVPPIGPIALAVSDIRASREGCLRDIVGD